jgi:DNA polymerase-3 subunit alpha
MRFKWEGKTRRRWRIWPQFQDLLDICESIDGPDIEIPWFLDELETIGELELSEKFINLYNSSKKYRNPSNSSVAYFIGITDEAPTGPPKGMQMSEFRNEMPDIDLDFEDRYRDKVIEYTRSKFGAENTAQIATVSEIRAKTAVRDICRVLDLPYEIGDKISKAMPPAVFGVSPTLNKEPDKGWCFDSAEFVALYEKDDQARTIIDAAKALEGLWRSSGVHASGFLVADAPITNYIPVAQAGEGEPVVTQWEMGRAEQCGLLKIDFLGLRNLNMIARTIENIKETRGIDIGDPYKLLDNPDPKVMEALASGDNITVFQLEGDGVKDLILSLKPTEFMDIAALLALYRPGPMGSNVHNEYAARKNGRRAVSFAHPSLEPILEPTYGLMIYQEQLLAIAQQVAGKNIMEADELRKIVGKKIVKKMPAQRESFVKGCIKNTQMPERVANALFDEIEHHASYSLGKGHAVGYAIISYLTLYFKIHYPIEFMAGALSASFKKAERLALYLQESQRMGIEVKYPSVNNSEHEFIIRDNEIYFGLDGIHGFGDASVESVIKGRDPENPYRNIFDYMRRADPEVLNLKATKHLLKSGALDELLVMPGYEDEFFNRNQKLGVLFQEAQQLSIFLKEHPFTYLKDMILDKISHAIKDVNLSVVDRSVRVGGIITKVEKKSTKAGKKMYKLVLEDDTGLIEVVVFNKQAEKLDENYFNYGDLFVIEAMARLDNFVSEENTKPNLIYLSSEKIDYGDISTEPTLYLEAKKQLTMERLRQIDDIIKVSKGVYKFILKAPVESGGFVVIKFNSTIAPSAEKMLRNLLEV